MILKVKTQASLSQPWMITKLCINLMFREIHLMSNKTIAKDVASHEFVNESSIREACLKDYYVKISLEWAIHILYLLTMTL